MAKIKVLSKEISELIAAGEVIDRPSSVIKELLENSIDSGATNITVEIKNGGRTYMRITDNGCGIAKEDLPTAFLRHATSKISDKSDLNSISSLGFRGEALASICAVSRVSVLTKRPQDALGSHIINEGSDVKLFEDSGSPDGTTVVVRDLFFNVPARLKFLKKDVTEGNVTAAIINKIALSHPSISFKFIRDNRQELITAGDGSLFSAIHAVFGKDFAESLLKVSYSQNGVSVSGYIIKPLMAKSKRNFQNFFINGRYIRSVTCMVSLEEAYKNQIMTGKFPACVLMVDVDPSLVDVNVHPAKAEVKFQDEKLIYDAVYFAVKNALMSEETPRELNNESAKHFAQTQLYGFKPDKGVQTVLTQNDGDISKRFGKKPFERVKAQPKEDFFTSAHQSDLSERPMRSGTLNSIKKEYKVNYLYNGKDQTDETEFDKLKAPEGREFKYINEDNLKKKSDSEQNNTVDEREETVTKVLGEVFDTYIVCQRNDDMYLIDKHAAHERINFEKIKKSVTELDSQMLISPVNVLLSFEEHDALIANSDKAKKLGFIIEDAGAPFVNALGIPVMINGEDAEEAVSELAKNFVSLKVSPQLDILDELCHSIACKASIKGNIPSDILELEALCLDVFDEDLTKYCPHGRPIFVKLSKREIEKLFKRIV